MQSGLERTFGSNYGSARGAHGTQLQLAQGLRKEESKEGGEPNPYRGTGNPNANHYPISSLAGCLAMLSHS